MDYWTVIGTNYNNTFHACTPTQGEIQCTNQSTMESALTENRSYTFIITVQILYMQSSSKAVQKLSKSLGINKELHDVQCTLSRHWINFFFGCPFWKINKNPQLIKFDRFEY